MKNTILISLIVAVTGCSQPREVTSADGPMAIIVEGSNDFSTSLYDAARDYEGNLFFSPFSIAEALSMVYAGTENNTQTQIEDLLGVSTESDWHENMGLLYNDLIGNHHRSYTLAGGNAVWGQEDVPFIESTLDILDEYYYAPLESIDFASDPSSATDKINKWVSKNTEGYIDELFGKTDITSDTKLVLSNAIYFEAEWSVAFEEENTSSDTFYLADGSTEKVDMMHQTEDFGYAYFEDMAFSVLKMNYKDDEVAMYILLPDEDLSVLEDHIADGLLDDSLSSVTEKEVIVSIPVWEHNYELPLRETLESLGMTDAFSQELADFTGFVARADMGDNYYISASRHKAWISVDEAGTKAAAATGFGVSNETATEPITFVADHPFVYLIRDELTGTILFMGRYEKP